MAAFRVWATCGMSDHGWEYIGAAGDSKRCSLPSNVPISPPSNLERRCPWRRTALLDTGGLRV